MEPAGLRQRVFSFSGGLIPGSWVMCEVDEVDEQGANHHLWQNRRTWWVAFTVLFDGYRQERVRQSLGTRDLETARERRDALLREYAARPRVTLALRAPRPRPAVMLPAACESC